MTLYQVYSQAKGGYATGGYNPKFIPNGGKAWTKLQNVSSFLGMHHWSGFSTQNTEGGIPEDWEVHIYNEYGIQRISARKFKQSLINKTHTSLSLS